MPDAEVLSVHPVRTREREWQMRRILTGWMESWLVLALAAAVGAPAFAAVAVKAANQADVPANTIPLNATSTVNDCITVEAVLLPRKPAGMLFGGYVADNFAVIKTTISNHCANQQFILHNIYFDYSEWALSGVYPNHCTPAASGAAAAPAAAEPAAAEPAKAAVAAGVPPAGAAAAAAVPGAAAALGCGGGGGESVPDQGGGGSIHDGVVAGAGGDGGGAGCAGPGGGGLGVFAAQQGGAGVNADRAGGAGVCVCGLGGRGAGDWRVQQRVCAEPEQAVAGPAAGPGEVSAVAGVSDRPVDGDCERRPWVVLRVFSAGDVSDAESAEAVSDRTRRYF